MNLKVDMRRNMNSLGNKKFHRNSKCDYENGLQSPENIESRHEQVV
jgi:hypothetical protein